MESRELQFHIACKAGDVGRYCMLPGDPGRVEQIAAFLDDAKPVAANREFVTWTGTLLGEKVSVTSTGIGGPSAAISMEELAAIGADTFIRVGTCGGINLKVRSGDLVIASGSVRQEGTALHYAPMEYPAVSDYDVLSALKQAADALGYSNHVGVIQCKDSFYGQHSPERMPVAEELLYKWEVWKRMGVLASEMETATLMIAANALGVRSGTVLHTIWNQERIAAAMDPQDQQESHNTERAIRTAVDAIKLLIKKDR